MNIIILLYSIRYRFYIVNEKNRFNVETIRSIIIAKQHFKNITCSQFYEFLLKHPKLLNSISSSEKYEKIVESVEEGLSNS
jgi:hypothetical protein